MLTFLRRGLKTIPYVSFSGSICFGLTSSSPHSSSSPSFPIFVETVAKPTSANLSDSDGFRARTQSLSDFPPLPKCSAALLCQFQGLTPRRSPHWVRSRVSPVQVPWFPSLSSTPSPKANNTRRSSRVSKPPHYLLNQYTVSLTKRLKTAQPNAASGLNIRFEVIEVNNN